MSIRSVVLAGYGPGGTIPLIVRFGYGREALQGTPVPGRRVIRGRGGASRAIQQELIRQEMLKDDAAILLLLLSE